MGLQFLPVFKIQTTASQQVRYEVESCFPVALQGGSLQGTGCYMGNIVDSLRRQAKIFVAASAFAVAFLVAIVDYYAGFELSSGLFYLIPVFLVSWYVGSYPAIFLSSACAVLSFWVDRGTGNLSASPLIPYLTSGIRLGFFLAVVHLVSRMKGELETQKSLAQVDPLTGIANRRAFLATRS